MLLKLKKNIDVSHLLDAYDALIITIAPRENASYKETYLESSETIKESLAKRKKSLYLLYTSSTSVYGNQEGLQVNEENMRKPSSENSHLLCEVEDNYLSLSNTFITACVLRLGGIYGPERTLEDRALKMSGRGPSGTGQEPTNHSHLEDITRAIEFCVTHNLSGIYNLVADDHPTRKDLYNQLCNNLQVPLPIWKNFQGDSLSTNALVSSEKIKKTGFEFKHRLRNF
jgi:nucleoside-diphosphate-sugar epimerase